MVAWRLVGSEGDLSLERLTGAEGALVAAVQCRCDGADSQAWLDTENPQLQPSSPF
jgi:hypothetical protein